MIKLGYTILMVVVALCISTPLHHLFGRSCRCLLPNWSSKYVIGYLLIGLPTLWLTEKKPMGVRCKNYFVATYYRK